MILISACLAGENLRYDGGNKGNTALLKVNGIEVYDETYDELT
ncbi:DUF523 domain-containing protein [Staphylococcus coagulans]|nr:DUF523 domain-containing protein [Staphylococcus coagulans]